MGLTWLGDQLWMTVDPLTTFIETSAPCAAAEIAVEAVLPELRKDLGLGAVRVRWFRPESSARKEFRESTGSTACHTFAGEEGLRGRCHGNEPATVWVRSDLDALDAAETLAHELQHSKHYSDYVNGAAAMPDDDDGEAQALAYGHSVRQALLD